MQLYEILVLYLGLMPESNSRAILVSSDYGHCYDRTCTRLKDSVDFVVQGTIKSFGAISLDDQRGASEVLAWFV